LIEDIVTYSTEGRSYYATLLSLLGNRGRMVPWIRSPLGLSGCMETNSRTASVGHIATNSG
jgi:hypothetical protein